MSPLNRLVERENDYNRLLRMIEVAPTPEERRLYQRQLEVARTDIRQLERILGLGYGQLVNQVGDIMHSN